MEISINDERYPDILRSIKYPPQKLYVLGDVNLLNKRCISIIGSRNCSSQGANLAKKYAIEFCKKGYCVVSGLAKGIDTSAHIGALEARGKTIAVLGSGFNNIFPKENIKLFKKIIENGGAIISEYDEKKPITSKGFVMRDRIISGLSKGVVIAEAKENSGTAITADFAIKQGRKLFYIQNNDEENYFIKKGAKPTLSPTDVLNKIKEE